MSRPPPIWIAELQVIVVHPDGRRVPGHIAVGQPYVLGGGNPNHDESHCPVEIDSLYSREHPIIGGGTLQALLLGVQFLGMMLHAFLSDGGHVVDPDDGEPVSLDSLFGPMLRQVSAPSGDTPA